MKRSALLLLGLLASFAAQAQIYEYKDAAGKTVYTDQPPVGMAVKPRTVAKEASPVGNSNPAKSVADREFDFKKRQQDKKEAADKAQKDANEKALRTEDCTLARRQLQMLESGERMATVDDKGERVYMEDNQRAAEVDRYRKITAEACK